MASFYDAKHCVISMHLDDVKGQLVTCGTDKVIKVSSILFLIEIMIKTFEKHLMQKPLSA